MKRTLSSRLTFFWKVVFPLSWCIAIGLATVSLWTNNVDATGKVIPAWMKWQFLVMWLVGTLFILWLTVPLKRVLRDKQLLYISDFRNAVAIPLSAIGAVRESHWVHFGGKHPITIELKTPMPFGSRIVFIPTGRAPRSWPWKPRPHPIASELQHLIEEPETEAAT